MNIIVASCLDRGIGFKNTLPWKLKKDLNYFKTKTNDSVVIMGRKTYESLPLKPLPNRINIVLSRSILEEKGFILSNNFDNALEIGKTFGKKIFIIGGEQIFNLAIKHKDLDTIYYTDIKKDFKCDTFFPEIPKNFLNTNSPHVEKENDIEFEFKIFKKYIN